MAAGICALALACGQPALPAVPTIVVYLTDDLDERTAAETPGLEAIAAAGLRLSAVTPSPLCAPSRASLLTGRHVHNHGIIDNGDANDAAWAARWSGRSLPDWLRAAGWRTVGAGKFLNGVADAHRSGFDVWLDARGRHAPGGLTREGEYWLDDLTKRVAREIEATPADRPLFVYFAPGTPHGPLVAAPAYAGTDHRPLDWPPDFNESDISDKPPSSQVAGRPLLSPIEVARIERREWKRREMMRSVVDSLSELRAALTRVGRGDAWVLFTSDNGHLNFGEHRFPNRKGVPYEEAIRVPAFVLGPGVVPGRSEALVYVLDLTATVADLAGLSPEGLDGRSLVPLWGASPPTWRSRVLLEHDWPGPNRDSFAGVRTFGQKLVEYPSGEREAYDLVLDPFELQSTCPPPAFEDCGGALARRLPGLLACAGAGCWKEEN